ncbi:MAG TPA: alpha/beta fold hydrolase [Pyrinomonadaceae bacterium]|nr:alpha/beta fold hydrolase [Pyrinomonadaceae bacterium]HMP64617.1 alpha/beta fold hydrolase [Pyrinomonadaceae bacterium]
MYGDAKEVFEFGHCRLDAVERRLICRGNNVPLAPKVFDTLLMLVRNAGRVLGKDRMLAEIWEGSFVEENNLAQNISLLRRILGETKEKKFIETVPKFGYRFVADVKVDGQGQSETSSTVKSSAAVRESLLALPIPPIPPDTRYARNGDINIAYQVVGNGPVDIVFVMGWVSHLEYFWREPRVAHFFTRLASFSRLILFDKRGTGLSDRVPIKELPTLEQRMEDVHAVMDAVGSERAVLIGVSEGGPMCSLFAATYPERTTALVMFGTYAKRIWDADYPWAPKAESRKEFLDQIQREWGTAVGIEERAPSLADDPGFRDWWAEYLRMGASPGAAVALTKMNAEIDVRDVLPSIRVPTLVLHRTGDLCLKVEEGRYVASKIPGSEFLELPGIDHLPFVGDQDAVLNAIDQFITELVNPGTYDRALATVMNIKFGGSSTGTEGDIREVDVATEQSASLLQRNIQVFRGREVERHNGEALVTFDGPARAIRCASSILKEAEALGIAVKIGLHTGECDILDGRYGGVAVKLAEKISNFAETGSILVSRTVKDLVAGSGIAFSEYSIVSFDDVEGEWRLFTVEV